MSGLLQEAIETTPSKVGSKARSIPNRLVSGCSKAKYCNCDLERLPEALKAYQMGNRQLSKSCCSQRVQDVNPQRKCRVQHFENCFHP